jgi:hypothetical protein
MYAKRCPVHRTLTGEIRVDTRLARVLAQPDSNFRRSVARVRKGLQTDAAERVATAIFGGFGPIA